MPRPTRPRNLPCARPCACRLALVLLAGLLLGACRASTPASTSAAPTGATSPTAPPGADAWVVAVTLSCRYVVQEGRDQVTREGEGVVCQAMPQQTVGSATVLRVFDVRARLTIRSHSRDDYLVESPDLGIRVGDPWPPAGR